MDPFIAEIILFAGNFAPRGWAFCNGQLLSIAEHSALFSILGTTYGGDGRSTFALPDLRGRTPIHSGRGPGLSAHNLGQMGGSENTTLTVANMPSHSHGMVAVTSPGTTNSPENAFLGAYGTSAPPSGPYATDGTATSMNGKTIGNTGNSQPVANMQPYIAMNYIIALQGIFPSRN